MCAEKLSVARAELGPVRLLLYLLASVAAFSGCASNPATGGRDLVFMSEEKEIMIGRAMHPQILQVYGVYRNEKLQKYVQRIGKRLADNSHRPDLEYTFTVLDSPEVNAFATPGGFIYITRGLLAYLNSEAELSGVLGHEIGHVTARHAVRQQSRSALFGAISTATSVAAGSAGAVADMLGGVAIRGYGRSLELEADELGAQYMVAVGYESQAMLDVIGVLKNQELFEIERANEEGREPKVYHGIFSTHPDNDKRLREAVKAAETRRLDESDPGIENRDAFMSLIDGLQFGQTKGGGVVRENEFMHGGLGIGITFPKGWRIDDGPSRVTATAPLGNAQLVVSSQRVRNAISPRDILVKGIGLEVLQDERPVYPDGMDGYTAIAPDANSPYGRRPVRYGVIVNDEVAYVIAGATSDASNRISEDWKFLTAIKSFRLLDNKVRRQARPNVIRVVRATEGTTMRVLAAASPLSEYQEQRIRLLNNLYPEGEPKPGELVKVVD